MGKDYTVDITKDLVTLTLPMEKVSDNSMLQLNWTLAILADYFVYRHNSTYSTSSVGD